MHPVNSAERGALSSKRTRRVLSGVLLLVAVVGLLELIEWPFLRQPLESMLSQSLAREVQLGKQFGVRFFWPLRIRSDQLRIAAATDGPQRNGERPDFLQAKDIHLKLPYSSLWALLSGPHNKPDQPDNDTGTSTGTPPAEDFYIASLDVKQIDVRLLRDEDGRANWLFGSDEADKDKDGNRSAPLPSFGRLVIEHGSLVIDDRMARIELRAAIQTHEGRGDEVLSGNPGLLVTAEGRYQDRPVSGKLQAGGLLALADATTNTTPEPVQLELRADQTELDFTGKVADLLKVTVLDGAIRLAGPSLAAIGDVVGITLPTTNTFEMRGHLRKDAGAWLTEVASLSIGDSRLRGNFRYETTSKPPNLSGKLSGSRLALLDLGPAIGTQPEPPQAAPTQSGAKPPAQASSVAEAKRLGARASSRSTPTTPPPAAAPDKPSGDSRVLPTRDFDLPSLAAMDADIAIELDQLNLGSAALHDIAPFKAHLRLTGQRLEIDNILARIANGELGGKVSLDAATSQPQWGADLHWSDVQLDRFIKPAKTADDREQQDEVGTTYVTGTLGGQARLQGVGRSTAEMLGSLDGSIQMWVVDGAISHFLVEVAGIDIAQALGMMIVGDDKLPMQCAVAALNVNEGTIAPQIALVETSDSTLSIKGAIKLSDEHLQLVLKTEPKDWSPASLRSPVFIEGSFAAPEVRLDKTEIGLRLFAAAALATIAPAAAVLPLIDFGEEEKKACQDAIDRALQAPPPGSPATRSSNAE